MNTSAIPTTATTAERLVQLMLQACLVARSAVAHAADGIAKGADTPFREVSRCEKELDDLDREIDERLAGALTGASPEEVRTLLACLKMVVELERIGDHMLSLAGRAKALESRIPMEDVHDLVRMASVLEKMLADVHVAFSNRDLERALSVLRADSEIDRLRNLLFLRHVEGGNGTASHDSIHLLFMAQALERAGDQAKNLAEEVCYMISGHTVRHLLRETDQPHEQMYLRWLREQLNRARD